MAFSLPASNFNFSKSFSPSKEIDIARFFVDDNASDVAVWDKASKLSISFEDAFGPNAPNLAGALGLDSTQFLGGLAGPEPPSWTFITAPEDVSWDIANNANRVDIFGTNNPPVVAGSRGMRDLTLSNSLVEGFMRGVSLEGKVAALENLMNYSLNSTEGFVSVPVYQVWASKKSYGGPKGFFIIKDVKVKEAMRDLQGNVTRAYVDISLMQVPEYQVNSGRDAASAATAGAKAGLLQAITDQANMQIPGKGGTNPASPTAQASAGPKAGGAAQQSTGSTAKDEALLGRQDIKSIPPQR